MGIVGTELSQSNGGLGQMMEKKGFAPTARAVIDNDLDGTQLENQH